MPYKWSCMKPVLLGAVCVVAAVFSGCASVGPDNLRNGRLPYNDAILATSDEQLLQNIVRLRFDDSVGFLTVSSITANISVKASGLANVVVGTPGAYGPGNAIPFVGSVSTEQNPTVTYTPVTGDRLMRQFMGETPVDLAILLMNSSLNQGQLWKTLVRRVNQIGNPEFLEPPAIEADVRFTEITALISELHRKGSLHWVRLAGAQTGHALTLHSYSPARSREVARLLELLGVRGPAREGADVIMPIEFSVGVPTPGSISIETRSLLQLMQLAAAGIALPAELEPTSRSFPPTGPAGRDIRIQSSATRPANTRLATEYGNRWYYIDAADQSSKQWFFTLQLLSNAQLPDKSLGLTPLLTIPSSGR